jgi:hypothetical protein
MPADGASDQAWSTEYESCEAARCSVSPTVHVSSLVYRLVLGAARLQVSQVGRDIGSIIYHARK